MKKIIYASAAVALLCAAVIANADFKQVGNTHQYIGLSTDTKLTSGVLAGSTFTETNTGIQWRYTGSAWVLKNVSVAIDTVTLTAPGNSAAVATAGYTGVTFWFTVASINTSVTMRFRGRTTKQGWASLDAENDSLVVARNGTFCRSFLYVAGTDSLRQQFLSEAGGTAAFVTTSMQLWNEIAK